MFFISKLLTKIFFFQIIVSFKLEMTDNAMLMVIVDLCMIVQSLTIAMSAMQQLKSLFLCLLINLILATKMSWPFVILLITVLQYTNQNKITLT